MLRRDGGGRDSRSNQGGRIDAHADGMAAPASGYEYIVTGAVLLLAAGFDAVVRRRRAGWPAVCAA